MKVLIVGLGLMGGAYALNLSKKGYEVYGVDIDQDAIDFAKENNYIKDGSIDPSLYIPTSNMIILCFYPHQILEFLDKYHHLFNENQIITDICGVKEAFVYEAYNKALPAVYVSHHPMAGREKVGVKYSHLCNFKDANFLITPSGETDEYIIDKMKKLGSDLEFKKVTVMDPDRHDMMIAFTSQLTHAIAVSLVNSDQDSDTVNFIGDSYRDLTRIAMINENLWTELFFANRDSLLKNIYFFESELDKLKGALYRNDKEALKQLFIKSTNTRKKMIK